MLAESKRAQFVADALPLWLGRFASQAAQWVFAITLASGVWLYDVSLVPLVLVARFAPRPILLALPISLKRLTPAIASPFLLAGQAAVAFAVLAYLVSTSSSADHSAVLIAAAAAVGALAALDDRAGDLLLVAHVPRRMLGRAAEFRVRVDRAAMVVGGLAGGISVWFAVGISATLGVAGLALLFAALLTFAVVRSPGGRSHRAAKPDSERWVEDESASIRKSAIYQTAAFGSGALAGAVTAASLSIHPVFGAIFVGLIGFGLVIGSAPVPRILLRISAPMLLLLTVAACVAAVLGAFSGLGLVIHGSLVLLGIAAATQNSLRAIALRRLASANGYVRLTRASSVALGSGQVLGSLAVWLGEPSWDPVSIVVAVAVAQLLLVGGAFVIGGVRESLQIGGLSSLPIRSVIHKLSWDTRPAAAAADFAAAPPRVRRLAKWISEQVTLQRLEVTLPISRKEYEIYRPDDASRDRLFEAGRADPEKQMPYWAKVWPSGVALADVVVERKDEVADKHVLELGAGLGVTASVVLESGGDLVTADYSALPLAHCRLSTVVNTGRAPRATCFNWRHEAEIETATRQPDFRDGFPLILAADVLYEGRDAIPLMNVIERLLTADGSLWLAEPVRRTAQRFLDSAAELGWDTESRQVQAAWPDATDGPVNLHFLTRSVEPDRVIGDLGGFRI